MAREQGLGWWIGSGLVGFLVACLLGWLAGSGFPSILVNRPFHKCEGPQFPDGSESIGFQKYRIGNPLAHGNEMLGCLAGCWRLVAIGGWWLGGQGLVGSWLGIGLAGDRCLVISDSAG